MRTRTTTVDLGQGHVAHLLWQPGGAIPFGMVECHGSCHMVIRWVDVGLNAEAWTLASISPLTLVEPMCCVSCGLTGSVIDGRWIE